MNQPVKTRAPSAQANEHANEPAKEQAEALAGTMAKDQFARFLDQVPTAIIVSEIRDGERIVYANANFERISGQSAEGLRGKPWSVLLARGENGDAACEFATAVVESHDWIGTFVIKTPSLAPRRVEAYSNVIVDDAGIPAFRLAALLEVTEQGQGWREKFEQQIREKDALMQEIQHRVKNNLQMITALIRIEARKSRGRIETASFDRLAGRVESIGIIYKLLSRDGHEDELDLGAYLSDVVSSVMRSHATEGVRLNLEVDSYPVSVNVALPTGLVVNELLTELLTNALKYAFDGRDAGTITLHSLADATGCRVLIADDGVGLPDGVDWPKPSTMGALILRSLRENAGAEFTVDSSPGKGTRFTLRFTRAASAPEVTA